MVQCVLIKIKKDVKKINISAINKLLIIDKEFGHSKCDQECVWVYDISIKTFFQGCKTYLKRDRNTMPLGN